MAMPLRTYFASTLATLLFNAVSLPLVLSAPVAQCKADGTVCSDSLPQPEKGNSLIQSGMMHSRSVLPGRAPTALPDLLEEDEDGQFAKNTVTSPEDPAFYVGVCLDMLVFLIIADGIRRFRRGDGRAAAVAAAAAASVPQRSGTAQAAKGQQSASVKKDTTGELVLHTAVREGSAAAIVKLLGQAGPAQKRRLLAEADLWGCTALHLAADAGSEPLAALLLEWGAKVGTVDAWDQAPLHFAARTGSVSVCKLLLENGAVVDAVDAQDHTPLHIAAKQGHEGVCELLLEHGGSLCSTIDADVPPMLSALLVQRMFRRPGDSKSGSQFDGDM